jgi:hypothetical protein
MGVGHGFFMPDPPEWQMARNSKEHSAGMASPILTVLVMMLGMVFALVVVNGTSETAPARIYVPEDFARAHRTTL